MIYEHEIPKGSKLYFGDIAKLKREIENISSNILYGFGYEEIVTPFFSYHQNGIINEKELVRFGDEKNHMLSLRADSTLDVVRLITKRLGRSIEHNRWFYIQPVFRYPSSEIYQVGAEYIGSKELSEPINISTLIYKKLELKPLLQISNMNIPKIISKKLDIPMDIFINGNLEKILKLDIKWLNELACLQNKNDLEKIIDISPNDIKIELEAMKKLSYKLKYENIIFSPLYYAKMRYYNGLFFRFFQDNTTLSIGGCYSWDDFEAVGFAAYIDMIIQIKGNSSDK